MKLLLVTGMLMLSSYVGQAMEIPEFGIDAGHNDPAGEAVQAVEAAEADLDERLYEENELDAIFDPVTGKRRYDDYQLIRVVPKTDEQINVLRFLQRGGPGLIEFWSNIPNIHNKEEEETDGEEEEEEEDVEFAHVDMLVNPKHLSHVKGYLTCSGLIPTVMLRNIQEAIDTENIRNDDDFSLRNQAPYPILPYASIYHAQNHNNTREKRGTFGDLLRDAFGPPQPDQFRNGRNVAFNNPRPNQNLPLNPVNRQLRNPRSGQCNIRSGFDWGNYHRINKIYEYVTCLTQEFSDRTTLYNIGSSSEGRPLFLVEVHHKFQDNSRKPAIWIDGGIHAREWASPAAVTFMLNEFVVNHEAYENIFSKYNVFIMPSANPDGYEYSHTNDRLWRKTRSRRGRGCVGVDPNRNWGFNWGGQGASRYKCDETYMGPDSFSEPETAAIRDFIMARQGNWKLYLTFHSYGQYILYPWGYARKTAPHDAQMKQLGILGKNAAKTVAGRKYKVGTAAKMLYPAAGGSDDWAYGGAGIQYSYTVELPDTGYHGFLLPADQAEGVGREATVLTAAMINGL